MKNPKRATRYWLMKSEPEVYSIADLRRDHTALWTGVRNYQARNYMLGVDATAKLVREATAEKKKLAESMTTSDPLTMESGDQFLFYHSNAEPTACVGYGTVEKVGVPDPEQFNKKLEGFEPKAKKEKPMWYCAEVRATAVFAKPVTLEAMRADQVLAKMLLLQKGSRLSIQPVTETEFKHILKLGLGD